MMLYVVATDASVRCPFGHPRAIINIRQHNLNLNRRYRLMFSIHSVRSHNQKRTRIFNGNSLPQTIHNLIRSNVMNIVHNRFHFEMDLKKK